MAKKLDLTSGLGDITSLMHNQGLADLSWLDVDEAEYRAHEALPKQNLDMIPELQKALDYANGVPNITPLRPHTIVNRNPSDTIPVSAVDMTVPIRNRVAKLVMAGASDSDIETRLGLEFAAGDIQIARPAISAILAERGVIGNVYVDASHFPRAASDPREKKLAAQLSKSAVFVVGGCGGSRGCPCGQTGYCSVFGGKRVVAEVPYGPKLAALLVPRLAAEKRPIQFPKMGAGTLPVSGREWKEIIRSAFNKSAIAPVPDGVQTVHTQHVAKPIPITKADVASYWARRATSSAPEPLPSPAYMKYARRMMEGHDDTALLIASGNPELATLAGEYGLLGHSYVDMDALGGCKQALALVKKSQVPPDFVVRRASMCDSCMCAEDGPCAAIGKSSFIVDRRPSFDIRSFARSLLRAAAKNLITMDQARVAGANAKALTNPSWTVLTAKMNLFTPPQKPAPFSGISSKARAAEPARADIDRIEVDPEEVRRSISHLMNTGLSGKPLLAAVLSRYSRRDLQELPEVGRRLASEDGVQGYYFIDPTAYSDYGRGCEAGSKAFRKREGSAPYVLASSECTGCMLQTAPGWCSKYSKEMIRQVPTQVRKASSEAKRALPVVQPQWENPVEKYGLASEEMTVEIDKPNASPEIKISGHSVGD